MSDPVEQQAYQSLARLAWGRLRRHWPAMVCLGFILVVTVLCFGAPWLSPDRPDTTRTWLGALPPGSSHPEVAASNRFEIGNVPRTVSSLQRAGAVSFQCREQVVREYRVLLRRGRISRIQDTSGMAMLPELALGPHARSGGTVLPEITLRVGEAVPAVVADQGRVLLITLADPDAVQERQYHIALADGVVTEIRESDQPITGQLVIDGASVVSVVTDGHEQTRRHWLGTDELGRDVLARVLYGGRISLTVGVVATLVSALIGILYGAISGYAGGRVDRLLMGAVDVLYAIPFMFLVILLLVLFGRHLIVLFAALGAVQWLTTARIVRGQVWSLRERAFIEAARLGGAGHLRILLRHLIPNCLGPIVVYTTLTVPVVVLEESFLAFIGLQVEWGGRPLDSWGALVHIGARGMEQYPWLLLAPAILMSATLLAMNVLGDALRDAIDPQLQERVA